MVNLASSNLGGLSAVPRVTVAADSTSATFTITTLPAASATQLTISGTYNGVSRRPPSTSFPAPRFHRTGWSVVSVDSQETICGNGVGNNAIDGNPSTMWHTQFCPSTAPMPHEIQIDLGASYDLTGFEYLPRQDGSASGWIKQYEFYVSTDGVNWGAPVAAGTFRLHGLCRQVSGAGRGSPAPRLMIAFPAAIGALHPACGPCRRSMAIRGHRRPRSMCSVFSLHRWR